MLIDIVLLDIMAKMISFLFQCYIDYVVDVP